MCLWLIFGMYSQTILLFFFFSYFDLGFDLFNNGFYCTKFDFPFNSSCKYMFRFCICIRG